MPLNTVKGILSPASILLHTDGLAAVLKQAAPTLGRNAPNESATAAYKAHLARLTSLGNGSTTYPGLGLPALASGIQDDLDALVQNLSWDKLFAKRKRVISELDSMVTNGKPSSWSFVDSTNQLHAFDLYLQRLNGTSAPAAGTPTAGTLTAANDASGRMAECSGASRPYLVHTLVGDKSWKESLPSANATVTTIAAPNNSYTYQIAGTVPAGVSYVRIYRGYYGDGSGGTKYWVKDYACTAGASYPAIPILEADAELRTDLNPPSWCQAMMVPEFAAWYALAFATAPNSDLPMQYQSSGMLSPQNVLLMPTVIGGVNQILGLGNVQQHGLYGLYVVGTGNTAYGILTANNATGSAQGFGGAYGTGTGGLQARVTSVLDAAGTATITYTYYSSTLGWGVADTATGLVSDSFTGTAVGSTANFDIPAGRIVRSATITAVGGGLTSGQFVVEAGASRAY